MFTASHRTSARCAVLFDARVAIAIATSALLPFVTI
jgi:hypothetical protein